MNNYRAEYGRTGGAQIQIVSKSGGAQHAGQPLLLRPPRGASTPTASSTTAPSRDKPRYRFNTYGLNLGGPVPGAEKKLFFFYSLEAPITERPATCSTGRCRPSASGAATSRRRSTPRAALIVIRDPQTGQPFPGNIIPAKRINTNGQALLNLLPLPTLFDRASTGGKFNHQTQATADNPNSIRSCASTGSRRRPTLLLHLQGLALRPARRGRRRRHDGRPGRVGLVQRALPEHRPRRQRQLHEDRPDRTSSTRRRSASGSRPSSSTRCPTPTGSAPAAPAPATRSASSIRSSTRRSASRRSRSTCRTRRTSPSTTGCSRRARPGCSRSATI